MLVEGLESFCTEEEADLFISPSGNYEFFVFYNH